MTFAGSTEQKGTIYTMPIKREVYCIWYPNISVFGLYAETRYEIEKGDGTRQTVMEVSFKMTDGTPDPPLPKTPKRKGQDIRINTFARAA